MRRVRAAFTGFILADLFMLLVAQGPTWDIPKNTSLFLNSSRSDVCDRVTNLDATSATGAAVVFTVVYQDPHVGFKVVPDINRLEDVLQCSIEKIEDKKYTVVVRANYSSGSSAYTDLTLNITFAKSKPDVDECIGDPCENGGECTDLIDGYKCSCKPGFNGTKCEMNIDECATVPCKNGGQCIDQVNSYRCTCEHGFTGTTCETISFPTSLCDCRSDKYWNGKTCVAKASVCSDSCDTTALVVVVVLLSIVAVTFVIYVVYLRLKMKRNSGQLGTMSKETSLRTKSQEPKYVNLAYVENETHAYGQLENRGDLQTPEKNDLDKGISESDDTQDKIQDDLPVAKSEIQAPHGDITKQEERDLDKQSNNSNGSKDDGQNPRNVNGSFAEGGKLLEGQTKIQEQLQDVGTQEKPDQDEETKTFNASKDERNTGIGKDTERQ